MKENFYVILDYVCESSCELWFLFSEDFSYIYKKWDFSNREMTECFCYLLEKNLIDVYPPIKLSETGLKIPDKTMNLTKNDIEKAIYSKGEINNFRFILTSKGGKMWEEHYKPKWEKYYSFGYFNNKGKIYANNMIFLRKIYSQVLSTTKINFEMWKTLKPYYATYWKVFPKGHVVQFKSSDTLKNIVIKREPWKVS